MTLRCLDEDADLGRCQLNANHAGAHAGADSHAYVTWQHGQLVRWSKHVVPRSIADLPWFATFHPALEWDVVGRVATRGRPA